MNGRIILIGGVLILAVIMIIADQDWRGLRLFVFTLILFFGTGRCEKQSFLEGEVCKAKQI